MPADARRKSNRERLAARARGRGRRPGPGRRAAENLLAGTVAAVVVLVALVAVIVVQTPADLALGHRRLCRRRRREPRSSVGSAAAPVTVDLYEDFQCPNCKALEAQSGSTLAQLSPPERCRRATTGWRSSTRARTSST